MEPDPAPEPRQINTSQDTQITNKDINSILGIPKKKNKQPVLYLFSKRAIIVITTITTFVYLSFHYFGMI